MSDSPFLTNNKASFDANANPDIKVRTTESANGHLQHVRLDLGSGASEALASGAMPTTPYSDSTEWTAVSASDIVNTTSTTVKAAGGAGVRFRLFGITVSNMSPSVATRVDILDGATVIWSGPASAGGGGYSKEFKKPKKLTANTDIKVQCGTTGAQVRVALDGDTTT